MAGAQGNEGFGFRISGFQVSGSRFQVLGSGFRVLSFGIRDSEFWFRVSDFGFRDMGSAVLISKHTRLFPSLMLFIDDSERAVNERSGFGD